MQLKRDTDFAMRILTVIAEAAGEEKKPRGIYIKQICDNTDVPRQTAIRLCGLLTEAGFIKKLKTNEYKPVDDIAQRTVYDVVMAVEGQCELIAIFDRRTELYARFGHTLEHMSNAVSNELKNVTVKMILDGKRS